MDALFQPEEMATSNMDGKRKKVKLDEARVDLVKRKLMIPIPGLQCRVHGTFIYNYLNKTLCLFYTGLAKTAFPPSESSPFEKKIRKTMNAKCREVRFKNKKSSDHGEYKEGSDEHGK